MANEIGERPTEAEAATEPPATGLGEMSLALLREWAPLLKPTGVGLLATIHAWEEQNHYSPFYGWMHIAQERLAAYMDVGRTTIVRYCGLLDTCGLIERREVSQRRRGYKMHQTVMRAMRGEVQPSLRLLEYLAFDADDWTRKHTAWLLTNFQPISDDSELARNLAAMRRAYTLHLTTDGLATITHGQRLTEPGSLTLRLMQRDLGRQQGMLLPDDTNVSPVNNAHQTAAVQPSNVASTVSPVNNAQGATSVHGNSGVSPVNNAQRPTTVESPTAAGIVSPASNIESGDVSPVNGNNVNVASSNVNAINNVNVAASDFATAQQAARSIDDEPNVNWHIVCLQRMGQTLYQQAITRTRQMMTSGKLRGKSGGYFTRTAEAIARQHGLSLRKGDSNVSPVNSAYPPTSPTNGSVSRVNDSYPPSSPPNGNVSPVNNALTDEPPAQFNPPNVQARQVWQAVVAELQTRLSGPAWHGWMRHAQLLQLEADHAVIGTPSGGLADNMARRHAAEVTEVFSQVLGREVQIQFVTRW